jgi:hypothetical protein
MVGAFAAAFIFFIASLSCICGAASFTFTEFAYKETSKNVRKFIFRGALEKLTFYRKNLFRG